MELVINDDNLHFDEVKELTSKARAILVIEMERSKGLIAVTCAHIILLFGFGIITSTIIHLLYYITLQNI